MATKPKQKKAAAKGRVKSAAVRRPAVRAAARAPQDRVWCIECGRELMISKWGNTERAIYCCGRIMACKEKDPDSSRR